MKIITRKIKSEDLDQVYNLLNILHENSIDYSLFKSKFEASVEDNNFYGLVATANNKVIGVIISRITNTLTQNNNFLIIDEIIIEERLRNKGIGTLLLRDTIRFAIQNNCEIAELSSNISNEQANNFCENNGFQKKFYKFTKKTSNF